MRSSLRAFELIFGAHGLSLQKHRFSAYPVRSENLTFMGQKTGNAVRGVSMQSCVGFGT